MPRKKKKEAKIPKTKKFGGKIYSAWMKEKSKREADKIAKQNRVSGTPARVVKIGNQYVVYTKGRLRY